MVELGDEGECSPWAFRAVVGKDVDESNEERHPTQGRHKNAEFIRQMHQLFLQRSRNGVRRGSCEASG